MLRSSIVSFGAACCAYLANITIARMYPRELASQYLYYIACGSFLISVIDFASEQCLVHYSRKYIVGIRSVWLKISLVKLTSLFFIIFVGTVINFSLGRAVPWPVLCLLFPAFYLGPIFENENRNYDYVVIMAWEKLSLLAITILIAKLNLSLIGIVVGYAFVTIGSIVTQIRVLNYRLPEGFFSEKNDVFIFKNYISNYYANYLVVLSQLFYGNISRIIVETKVGLLAFASLTLALQIVGMIGIIQIQVDRHIRPLIMDAVVVGNVLEIKKIVRIYLVQYVLPMGALSLFVGLCSSNIIQGLFGSKWRDAAEILSYASPLFVTISCMRLLDVLSIALDIAKANLLANLIGSIGLCLLLYTQKNGGAIYSVKCVVACQLTHVLVMFIYVNRVVKSLKLNNNLSR